MRTKPCLHCLPKGNTNTGSLETSTNHLRETICGISITPQSTGRGKRLRCAPANSPITRGRGVRKPIDRLLRPLALGAWTYATGSPTPKGLGSCSERPAALLVYRGFDTPGRCVPVPYPSSVMDDANGNFPFQREASPPALRLLRILRFPPQRPVPAATRP